MGARWKSSADGDEDMKLRPSFFSFLISCFFLLLYAFKKDEIVIVLSFFNMLIAIYIELLRDKD